MSNTDGRSRPAPARRRLRTAIVAALALVGAGLVASSSPVGAYGATGAATTKGLPGASSNPGADYRPGTEILLRHGGGVANTKLLPDVEPAKAGGADIQVTYLGAWPAQARTAFEYAASIWESVLSSPVPIVVEAEWASLGGGGILGSCGATGWWRNFTGAPLSDTWYASAAANRLAGRDLAPGSSDIETTLNSAYPSWYLGTDGAGPPGSVDFVTVAVHELGHGLGFAGAGNVSGGRGSVRGDGYPTAYDRYTVTGAGTSLLSLPDNSAQLATALTSNNVWFSSPNVGRVQLYAPSSWKVGSSYSHLDENAFPPGHTDSLMTPYADDNEVIHRVGPITQAILGEAGWGAPSDPGGGSTTTTSIPGSSTTTSTSTTSTTSTSTTVPGGPGVTRIAGADRYDTAVRIAETVLGGPQEVVFVATGANWPDGILAGAAAQGSPILLVEPGGIPAVTAAALQRFSPELIVVLGGSAAISDTVVDQLSGYASGVQRLGGSDRYETAAWLMQFAYPDGAPLVFVAPGDDYPRALLAAAEGGVYQGAALLVPSSGPLPDSVREALAALGPAQIWIVGCTETLGPDVEAELGAFAPVFRDDSPTVPGLSQQVWDAVEPGDADGVILATQENFPDALVGAGFAGLVGQPLALVSKTCVPAPVADLIARLGVDRVTLLGGTAALGPSMESLPRC